MIAVICNLINTPVNDLLPHYFKHYSNLGINKFYFGIYGPKNSSLWDEVRDYGKGLDVSLIKMECATEFNPMTDADFKNQIGQSINGWIIPTDGDEFHMIEGYDSFQKLREDCEAEGANFVWRSIVDRITADGSIPLNIDPNRSIWEQFPNKCHITRTIADACGIKTSMFKSGLTICTGHHIVTNTNKKEFSKGGETHHFKWWGKLKEKEQKKVEIVKQLDYPYIEENKRVIKHLETFNSLK